MNKDHPSRPTTAYGAAKLAGEAYARSFHQVYGPTPPRKGEWLSADVASCGFITFTLDSSGSGSVLVL